MNEDLFTKPNPPALKIITSDIDRDMDDMQNDSSEMVAKLEGMANELSSHRKDSGQRKLENDQLSAKVYELERTLEEMDQQIKYYEGVMQKEGLVPLKHKSEYAQRTSSQDRGSSAVARQEAQKMQEAAQATIH